MKMKTQVVTALQKKIKIMEYSTLTNEINHLHKWGQLQTIKVNGGYESQLMFGNQEHNAPFICYRMLIAHYYALIMMNIITSRILIGHQWQVQKRQSKFVLPFISY